MAGIVSKRYLSKSSHAFLNNSRGHVRNHYSVVGKFRNRADALSHAHRRNLSTTCSPQLHIFG
eukprot:2465281-Amphidinium_carterae.1